MKSNLSKQDITYIYDGTFYGLLCVLFISFRDRIYPHLIESEENSENRLFNDKIFINTDENLANKFINIIKKNLSELSLKRITLCYLSEVDNFEMLIYEYLRLGWTHKNNLDSYMNEDPVLQTIKLTQKVLHEKQRLLGLVRFKLTNDDIYYAKIDPDYNILPLISDHFAKRMSRLNWIIHDEKRDLAAKYSSNNWQIVNLEIVDSICMADDELFVQTLWNNYFKNVSIKERENKRQQKLYMPQRYWKNLVEEI